MTENYSDEIVTKKDSAENILKNIAEAKSSKEFADQVQKYFPDWIVCALDKYSSDYKYLQNNWKNICEKTNTTPQKIILVSDITFSDTHKIQRKICEILTLRGHVVRRSSEYIACSECGAAIPSRDTWTFMEEKNLPVPREWKNKCNTC